MLSFWESTVLPVRTVQRRTRKIPTAAHIKITSYADTHYYTTKCVNAKQMVDDQNQHTSKLVPGPRESQCIIRATEKEDPLKQFTASSS